MKFGSCGFIVFTKNIFIYNNKLHLYNFIQRRSLRKPCKYFGACVRHREQAAWRAVACTSHSHHSQRPTLACASDRFGQPQQKLDDHAQSCARNHFTIARCPHPFQSRANTTLAAAQCCSHGASTVHNPAKFRCMG